MYKECPVEEKCGFYIETKGIPAGGAVLVFASKERKAFYAVNTNRAAVWTKKGGRYLEKGIAYYRAHGVSALGAKVYRKFFTDKEKPVDYQKWIKKHLPGPGELEKQQKTVFPGTALIQHRGAFVPDAGEVSGGADRFSKGPGLMETGSCAFQTEAERIRPWVPFWNAIRRRTPESG